MAMAVTKATQAQGEVVAHPSSPRPPRRVRVQGLFSTDILWPSLKQAFVMLRPDLQWSNPVMFVVEIGSFLTLFFVIQALFAGSSSQVPVTYFIALDAWLFLTVVFANFATAVAEARGRAQAESLRKTRQDTPAHRLRGGIGGTVEDISSAALVAGDLVRESAPVIRESGGDRSGVTGGTLVLSDEIVVQITARSGESFLDRVIALVEGA